MASVLKSKRIKCYLTCVATTAMILCLFTYCSPSISRRVSAYYPNFLITQPEKDEQCPSVLQNMVYGHWKKNKMTKSEQEKIEKYLDDSRAGFGLKKTLQRDDYKCGNVSFPNLPHFRGLCDRRGKTPCCYNNVCVDKTIEQCACKGCYDMRQRIHAEYSEFIPHDRRCRIKKFDHQEACKLLSGSTLAFVGDSYVRHIYTAFLLLLTNNYYNGALKPGVDKKIQDQCAGIYIFTEHVCRLELKLEDTGDVCGGKVKVFFRFYYSFSHKNKTLSLVKQKLLNKSKSFLVLGIGIWDHFNAAAVKNEIIKPVYNLIQNHTWPQLVWATPHAPGILKRGELKSQTKTDVLRFISNTSPILSDLNIPQFNSFNMTEGVMSFDGNHYGYGVNIWKVHILLNYIKELKQKGIW